MNKIPEGFQEGLGGSQSTVSLEGFQEGLPSLAPQQQKAPTTSNTVSTTSNEARKTPASVDEFVQQIAPVAQRIAQKIGAPVEAVIGQLGLETGWGKSVIPGTNNYGNIKDTSGGGVAATDNMNGSRDRYRQYASADDFADDYAKLVGTNPRYKGAVGAKDAQSFFTGLKQGGYAEDPNYVQSGVAASQTVAKVLRNQVPTQPSNSALPDLSSVPKWGEIAASEKFAKLPEAEKLKLKNSYFEDWIAPHAAASGDNVDALRTEFIGAPVKQGPGLLDRAAVAAKDVLRNMNPFASTPSLMEGVSQTERQANTERFNLPISKEARAKLDYQYNTASPEQRIAMAQTDGVAGMYFGELNKQYGLKDKAAVANDNVIIPSGNSDIGDPRVDARARQLMKDGTSLEAAQARATTAAQIGLTPGDELYGTANKSNFDFETQAKFEKLNPVVRGAVKGYEGFKQGSLGVFRAASDLVGADDASKRFAAGAAESTRTTDAIGENKNYAANMFEGAVSSIAQQLPMLVGGALTGSELIVLASMGVQSFGQEYSNGRDKGLAADKAAERAGLFAAFEVIGERFGLGESLKGIRKTFAGAESKEIIAHMAKALAAEVPGEMLTTTGQFATDKVNSFGLNKEAGWAEYLSQMRDTVVQTVMQGGLMMGGTGGVRAAADHLSATGERGAITELNANSARDRALSKWENNPLVQPAQNEIGDKVNPIANLQPDGRLEPTGAVDPAAAIQQAEPAYQSPQAHPTEQIADSIVRDLAEKAGLPVEMLLPAAEITQPVHAPVPTPVHQPTQQQEDPEDWFDYSPGAPPLHQQTPRGEQQQDDTQQDGLADQKQADQSPEAREIALWIKAGDGTITESERAELSALQQQSGPSQITQPQEQTNGTQAAQAQQTEAKRIEQQQVPADAAAGIAAQTETSPNAVAQAVPDQQIQAPQTVPNAAKQRTLPDDLLGLLNASGGISASLRGDIDQDAKGRPGLYRAAGRNIDEIGALMAEHGYITPDQANNSEVVLDALRRAVGGERIMTAQGMENAQAKEEELKHRATLAERASAIGINPANKSIAQLETEIDAHAQSIEAMSSMSDAQLSVAIKEAADAQKKSKTLKNRRTWQNLSDEKARRDQAALIARRQQEIDQRKAASEARHLALIQESAEAEQVIEEVLNLFGSDSPSFRWLADKFAELSKRETADQRKSGYDSLVRAARQAINKWNSDQSRIESVIQKSLEDGYGSTENPFGQSESVTVQTEPEIAAGSDRPGSLRSGDESNGSFTLEAPTKQSLAEKVAREGDQALADKQTADAQREGFTLDAPTAPEVRTENNADMFGEASGQDIQKGKEIERERQLASGQSAPADLFSSPESNTSQITEASSGAASSESTQKTKAADQEIIEHVTKKGDTIKGVIRRDLTKQQATDIDPYTFPKDGGFFIREKHVKAERRDGIEIQHPDFIPARVLKAYKAFLEEGGTDTHFGTDKAGSFHIEESAKHNGLIEFGNLKTVGNAKSGSGQKEFSSLLYFRKSDLDSAIGNPSVRTESNEKQLEIARAEQETSGETPPVSANTIFTEDAAEKARARLKAKMGRMNSGIDPEMLVDGVTLAGYHIEKGARTFAAYAKAMIADLGDGVRPYLKSWYMGVKYDPRATGFDGMDSAIVVEAADENAVFDSDNQEGVETSNNDLTAYFVEQLANGKMPADNNALRKMVEQFDGAPADNFRLKAAQEALEAAIVVEARRIVSIGVDDRNTFDALQKLYASQPNLNVRTSTSVENQAYSTPAPLAFLASRLAGINQDTTVYEPTAGNGMLLIGANPRNATANELEDSRYANLQSQGYDAIQGDALDVIESGALSKGSQDAIITNPPFGSVKDETGKATKRDFDGYKLGKIDHLIAAEALRAMKDDGKATLIIGADKAAGGVSKDDRIFFNWLYSHYNVTTHFELDGKLYSRQGAGWPVRVIAIHGRAESSKVSPKSGDIARVSTWEQVYEQFENGLAAQDQGIDRNGTQGAGSNGDTQQGNTDGSSGVKTAGSGGSRSGGRGTRAGNVGGSSPGNVAGRPGSNPGTMGQSNSGKRRDDGAPGKTGLEAGSGKPGIKNGAGTGNTAGSGGNSGVNSSQPAATENEFQSPYIPASSRKDEGVLIPKNMASPLADALATVEDEVGSIDAFAARELGYPNVEALHSALMGLQVDSVATAIRNLKNDKGTIIADQTGIGKGRQAAAIIRWANLNGHVPVFMTVKPQLFTDMYGDLADIGSHDIKPLIMNVDQQITGEAGESLFANKPGPHRARLNKIAQDGDLGDSNAVFLTYSQINTDNVQRKAIAALSERAVFILDESHNAGGESSTGAFVKEILESAKGVVYLSATYAKRPDNMPVYFKTDIGAAIADDGVLREAMSAGGLPLQTVVSNNLVKAGQMFRRERSYDGVSIETVVDTTRTNEHTTLSDSATSALRAIVSADKTFHNVYFEWLKEQMQEQGMDASDKAGNNAQKGVDHTEFSSVVHNFVRQFLLGLKADAAADSALASIARGEKPLIAVDNTMGSFLAEYVGSFNIQQGESLGSFDYRTVLTRALARSRAVMIDDGKGGKTRKEIRLQDLDPITRAAYDDAQKLIDDLQIDGIPVSPIDWIRNRIEQAGYSVAEITGRALTVDYSTKNPTLSSLSAEEQKDKVSTTRAFNGGNLDVLILNVAGSTGISLHASEKFKDQRQRHMIVAQAAQDINVFMQMLGRIHRTGQVKLPKFSILNVDLPAEKRPTAILSGKMKSLNANTSSNTESATSVKSLDMLNKYGDQVVAQYLIDNIDLARALDLHKELGGEDGPVEGLARKATGRMALMPVERQLEFYTDIEAQYEALIDYLNKTNQNDLIPRTFDFDAIETKSETLVDQTGEGPFEQAAQYNEYSIKAQGVPMTPDEIRAEIAESLAGQTAQQHADALIEGLSEQWADNTYKWRLKHFGDENGIFDANKARAYFTAQKVSADRIESMINGVALGPGGKIERPATQLAKTWDDSAKGLGFIRDHQIGSMWRVEINGDVFNAIVTNMKNSHKGTGNPFSLSKTSVTLALNGSLRKVTIPATQFARVEVTRLYARPYEIDGMFTVRNANERETAKVITGNLLAAYGELRGSSSTVISFTKQDGSVEQGILLPKKFDFTKNTMGDYRLKSGADAFKFLMQSDDTNIGRFGINSRDGVVRVLPNGSGIKIQVPKSKLKGGKYFLDEGLRKYTGDFVSVGSTMVANVTKPDAAKAIDVLMRKASLYALPSMADEARTIVGDVKQGGQALFSRSQESKTQEQIARELFGNPNPKSTVEQVTKELAGEGSLGPNIQIVQSGLDLPPEARRKVYRSSSGDVGLQAVFFTESGKVYVIADNIEPGEALAALMHDGGVHAGLYGMIGERGINSLAAQIKDWSRNSEGTEEGRIAKRALSLIPQTTADSHYNEEAVAYFITEAVKSGHGNPKPTKTNAVARWFARLWKMVESAIQKLGADPASLKVDDIVALARGALEKVKSGEIDPRRDEGEQERRLESRASPYSPEQDEFRKKAGIGARPTIRQKIARWVEGMKDSLSWTAFRQGALDQFHGIKLAEVATIGALPVEQSAYVTARLATGASSVMAGLLGHGQARWAANGQHLEKIDGTKGLLDILKPVEGQLDDFLGWMVATRASRLMTEGRENNFTPADIQAGLSLANGKETLFKQVAKDFADFKRSVLDIAQQAGLIDPVGRKVWDHADWIPFYRQMQDDTTKAPGGKRGLSQQSSGIRQLKGGESAMNDPLENILLNFNHLIDASLKNNALRKVIGNVEGRSNSDEFLQSVGYGMQGAIIPRDQIKKQLIAAGTPQQMIDALPAEALYGMAKMWALHAPQGKDIIRVMENGKPHFYRVTDPLLLKAVTSFEPFNVPGLATMRAFKRLLTRSVTATPAFMARNFIRDSASSAILNRDRLNMLGPFRGIVKSFKEEGGFEQMLFAGASFSGGQSDGADPEATASAMRRELRKKGFSAASADEFMASILDKPIKMWDAYSHISESIENANREAMFEAAKKSGKSDTAAAFEALDLMDFRLRGSSAAYQLFADIIPFVNARVQGLYRLGRSDMKQVAVRGGLMLLIPSVLLALANAGDDDYEALPDWDKDTYWHFFIGGKHFRIPKPFEVGVMFGTIPERITRAALGNDSPKKLAARVWFNVADQFNLVQWPQFIKPAIEVAMNEDGFSKRAIETISDKGKIPSMRASYYTSDTMKALAGLIPSASDATGLSPKRMEHLWNGYLGSVGSAALGVADMGVRRIQGQPSRESMRFDEYPLLGVFYRENPAKNSQYVEDLYKMAAESAELKKSFDAARKEGNVDRAKQLYEDSKTKIKASEVLGNATSSMSASSKQIEAIRKNADLTPDQKREKIDAVLKRRNEIAEKVAKQALKAWGGSI